MMVGWQRAYWQQTTNIIYHACTTSHSNCQYILRTRCVKESGQRLYAVRREGRVEKVLVHDSHSSGIVLTKNVMRRRNLLNLL